MRPGSDLERRSAGLQTRDERLTVESTICNKLLQLFSRRREWMQMSHKRRLACCALASALVPFVSMPAMAQPPARSEQIPSIDDRTNDLKKIDGFFPLYWNEAAGRLWLEIPKLDVEVLYTTGLASGLGHRRVLFPHCPAVPPTRNIRNASRPGDRRRP